MTTDRVREIAVEIASVVNSAVRQARRVGAEFHLDPDKLASTLHRKISAIASLPAPVGMPEGWIHEDELPSAYPYDKMFRHSEIRDGVRMFPVFCPPHSDEIETLRARVKELETERDEARAARQRWQQASVYDRAARVAAERKLSELTQR